MTPQASDEKQADSGDRLSPRQAVGGDRESGDRESGDTGVTQTNNPSLVVVVVNEAIKKISTIYEHEIGALTAMSSESIKDACDTYPADWIEEAIQIAVDSNVRKWKYVESILRNCKEKNVRPSLNKLEVKRESYRTGSKSSAKPKQPASSRAEYSDADLAAAELIRQRRQQAAVL